MSFGKNNSSKSGTSSGTANTTQNTNFTQTPTNPDWVTNLAQSLGAGVSSLQGTNPQSYIAGPTPLLTTAANSAGDLTGDPYAYAGASDVTRGVANSKAPDIAGNIDQFMNPALNDVVNSTLADYDHQAGLTTAQDDLNLAGSGAFGGSGAALTKAATAGELARGRATTEGNLRSNAFTQALGGATNQAGLTEQNQGLRLAAGGQLATIADQAQAAQRANIAAQDAAAQPIQQIAQAQAQAPLTFQQMLDQLFAGTNPSLFTGQTGTQDQTGVQTQTGNTTGNSSGITFGFGSK